MLTKHNQCYVFLFSSVYIFYMIDDTHLFHDFRFSFTNLRSFIFFSFRYRKKQVRYISKKPCIYLTDVIVTSWLLLFCLSFILRLLNTNKSIKAFFIIIQLLCTYVYVRVVLVIGGSGT